MLSARTIELVKATVPILVQHGETLTRHFYDRMFSHNPEVLAFFNPAHQHAGTQQRALAAAVCAYAQNIEDLAPLAEPVELIAHKHVSLGVQPEHYPIVGENLLASIREVLGDLATDELIAAWGEAYGMLADVLIAREKEIYREQAACHGWSGFRPFEVVAVEQESAVIRSLRLEPKDGGAVAAFRPGQFLTLRFSLPNGGSTMRNYSISSAPDGKGYRISVKREEARVAGAPAGCVSNRIHDGVAVGDVLEVAPPCGNFVLEEASDRPLVLISAGVGVTPMMSMLHAAVRSRQPRRIAFLHAARDGAVHAFRDEVKELAAAAPDRVTAHVRYSDPGPRDVAEGRCDSAGLVDLALIRKVAGTPEADFYFCGPRPFMRNVQIALEAWGVAPERQHHEMFGPAEDLASAPEEHRGAATLVAS